MSSTSVCLLREDRLKLFLPGAIDTVSGRPGQETRLWTLLFLDAWARAHGVS